MYFIESVSLIQGCPFRGVPLYLLKNLYYSMLLLHFLKGNMCLLGYYATCTEHSTKFNFTAILHTHKHRSLKCHQISYHTCTGHRNIFTTILLLSNCCFTSTRFNLSSLMAKTGTIIVSSGGSLSDTIMRPSL